MKQLSFLLLLTNFLVFAENLTGIQKSDASESVLGFKVTTGAAAGYVEDLACKS